MLFLFAPDSFKGSLSALRQTEILAKVAKRHFPNAQCIALPMADGGEGTLEALLCACGGQAFTCEATAPLGNKVLAEWGLLPDGTAVIEMAQASGLPLLPRLDPLAASSFGTGEVLRSALDKGARKVLFCLGGSGTNDGGMGFLQALGAVFTDESGRELRGCGQNLANVCHVDLTQLDARLSGLSAVVLCDVANPLLGQTGATYVYGPQKGVTDLLLPTLEKGMAHYADVLTKALGHDISTFPGAGAAGGMGAALKGVLGFPLQKGIDVILEQTGFDRLLGNADYVITGEGRLDSQSILYGKTTAGIAAHCGRKHVPVLVLTGGIAGDISGLYKLSGTFVMPIVPCPVTLEDAISNAEGYYEDAADRLFRLLALKG